MISRKTQLGLWIAFGILSVLLLIGQLYFRDWKHVAFEAVCIVLSVVYIIDLLKK